MSASARCWSDATTSKALNRGKFFGSFFQKRTALSFLKKRNKKLLSVSWFRLTEGEGDMPSPRIVSREDWLIERTQLLRYEKEFTRARDKLSAARRGLP